MPEENRNTIPFGKGFDGFLDSLTFFLEHQAFFRIPGLIPDFMPDFPIMQMDRFVQGECFQFFSSYRIDAVIEGDFIQPGRESIMIVVALKGMESFDEGFLYEIFSFFPILDHLVNHIINTVFITV